MELQITSGKSELTRKKVMWMSPSFLGRKVESMKISEISPIRRIYNPPSYKDHCHAPKKNKCDNEFEKILKEEMNKKNK